MVSVRMAPASSVPTCRPIDGDDRDQRIAQRVHADHATRRKALGARRAHIVLAQHLEHGRARLARNDRKRNGAKDDGRKNEMAERRPEGVQFAVDERVDGQEAGDRLQEELQADAAGHRCPAEVARKEDDQQQAPPEDRHGVADQGRAHQRLVEPRAALDRGKDAGRDAEQRGEDDGTQRQLDGCRKQDAEVFQHRALG